jgi:uncharacterized protein
MTQETVKATCNLIKNILSEKKELKRFHLYFFGGEPLMKFDSVVIPIIDSFDKQTKNADILKTVHITTNGALLTKDMIETLKHYGIFTSFQITFDGYGDTHNNSRFSKIHRKSYNMLVAIIKQLIMNDFHVTLRINFLRKNTHELNQVLDDFKDLDEADRAKIVYTPVRIWQDEPKRVTRSDCEKYPRSEEDYAAFKAMNDSINYAISLGMTVMPIESVDSVRYPCKHSFINAASVNYNGDVFKCCGRAFNDENRAGILTNEGMIKWENDTNLRILQKRTEHNIPCKSCILFPICGGGCVQSFRDFANTEYCFHQFDEASKMGAIKRYISILYDKNEI